MNFCGEEKCKSINRGEPFMRLTLLRRTALVAGTALFPILLPGQQQAPAAGAGISAEQVSKANNPLADLNALNFQDYYQPSLYSIPNANANTLYLRGAIVAGRQIIRATLPVATLPSGYEIYDLVPPSDPDIAGSHSFASEAAQAVSAPVVSINYSSGLGDFSIFDVIRMSSDTSSTQFGVGPLFVAPSATDKALGSGKWQAGIAAVAIHPLPGGSLLGALFTWQHSFTGQQARPDTSLFTFQPSATFGIGGGYYVRSTGTWSFDEINERYLIPIGIGAGKVFRAGNAVANAFIEPQFTVYHQGLGLPSIQILAGVNLQWAKKVNRSADPVASN
jgi:hypothetical protein